MNWFERHLNWVSVLSFIIFIPFALSLQLGGLVSVALGLMFLVGVNHWVLRQKKRNLLYLILLFIPLGWIWFLLLSNNRQIIISEVIDEG